MSRRLDDVRLAALMLDGIELEGRCKWSRSGQNRLTGAADAAKRARQWQSVEPESVKVLPASDTNCHSYSVGWSTSFRIP